MSRAYRVALTFGDAFALTSGAFAQRLDCFNNFSRAVGDELRIERHQWHFALYPQLSSLANLESFDVPPRPLS